MQTFIRVTEIWLPTRDRTQLEFGGGLYGSLASFREASESVKFNYGEGLPGKAWAMSRPLILKDLQNSYFLRGEAAARAGLTCGVALPIFAGDFLLAVVVFFCSDDRDHVGAIELWHHNPAGSYEMKLADGYFGAAQTFEWSARNISFMPGFGLPGMVWKTGMPMIMADLGRSDRFLRADNAQRVGINRGLAIPCPGRTDQVYVMAFLSALGTPIARRFEIWAPSVRDGGLVLDQAHCDQVDNLEEVYKDVVLARGEGTLGQVWLSGLPRVGQGLEVEPRVLAASLAQAGLTSLVALPVVDKGVLKAVVAWYF